jgi:hypothetical protein
MEPPCIVKKTIGVFQSRLAALYMIVRTVYANVQKIPLCVVIIGSAFSPRHQVYGLLFEGGQEEDIVLAELPVAKFAPKIGHALKPIVLTCALFGKECPRLRVFLDCDRLIRSDDFALKANSLLPQIPGQQIRCDVSIVRIADLGLKFQKQPLLLHSIAFGVAAWIVERFFDQNAEGGHPQHFINYYLPVRDMMQGIATQRPIKMAVGEIKLPSIHTPVGNIRTVAFLPAALQQRLGNVNGRDLLAMRRQIDRERTTTTTDVEDIIRFEPFHAAEQGFEVSQSSALLLCALSATFLIPPEAEKSRLKFSTEAEIVVRHACLYKIPAPAEIIAQQEDAEIHSRTQTKTTLDIK